MCIRDSDITFVGIIQTARASGLERFPIPYVLTNCHNSLCAVGGTINEDDHMFGLTCAKRYGGIYVPPHQAVIHQFAREVLAEGGKMILGLSLIHISMSSMIFICIMCCVLASHPQRFTVWPGEPSRESTGTRRF